MGDAGHDHVLGAGPLAIAGLVLLRRRRRALWPLVATAVTVTIVAASTYGQQRFRIAAEPALLVLARGRADGARADSYAKRRPTILGMSQLRFDRRSRRGEVAAVGPEPQPVTSSGHGGPFGHTCFARSTRVTVLGILRGECLQDRVEPGVARVVDRVARVVDALRIVGRGGRFGEHHDLPPYTVRCASSAFIRASIAAVPDGVPDTNVGRRR